MKAKIVYIALAFLMAVVLMLAAVPIAVTGVALAQGPTLVYISPSSQTVSPGEVFTVDIWVEPGEPIAGVQAGLSFDPALLTADSWVEGDLMNQNGDVTFVLGGTIDDVAGTIEGIGIVVLPAVEEEGSFVTITFTAGETTGTSPLVLTWVDVSILPGVPTDFTATDGDVTIEEAGISGCFISPASQTVSPGQEFTVDVYIEPAVAIQGVSLGLNFDPDLLTADSCEEGDLLNQNGGFTFFSFLIIDNVAGHIGPIDGAVLGATVSGPGSFATITFTAKETTGTSPLDLSDVLVRDGGNQPVETAVTGGSVTIEEEGDGEGCFIATAAYGTSTAEEIDTLRAFRDEVLLQSSLGSQLVALYYEVSPPVADFISEHEGLRTLVRELLVDPVVWVVDAIGTLWRD